MAKTKRTITHEDGTPEEITEEAPIVKTTVVWTKLGEDRGAWSEHGRHVEGEHVETEHADILIKNGFATAVGSQ